MNTYQNWVLVLGLFLVVVSAWENWQTELRSVL